MPTFTLELWRVIDLKPNDVSEDAWLGLDDYPLFDPDYREALNKKIKNHFMYQEIGHETVEQFTFSLRRKMHEIMPQYNELYRTTLLKFDPLSTMDIRTVTTGTQEQTAEGVTSSDTESDIDAKSRNVVSNFPQVMLSPNKDYASNGADANSQTKTTGTVSEESESSNTSKQDSDSHTKGYQGIPAQLIQAARAAIINVDMLVIAEVDECFMMTWGNSDEYSRTKGRLFY